MSPEVREIELDKIKPNHRLIFEEEAIVTLCRDIENYGLHCPIEVELVGHRFRILDGEKRWRACKKIGMKKIKAVIVSRSV